MKRLSLWLSVLMLVVWTRAYSHVISVESNGLNSVIEGRVIGKVSTESVESKAGKAFIRLKIEGFGVTSEIGKPELPVYRALVEVPDGAFITTNYTVLNSSTQNLRERGVEVYPVQHPIPKIPDPKIEFVYDNHAYSRDEFLPGEKVRVTEAGILRGHRLYLIEISPVRYNPVTGQLKIEDFRVEVNISGGNLDAYFDKIGRYTDFYTAKLLSSITINSRELIRSIPAQQVCYVIIAPDSYISELGPLADWRNSMGFHTVLVPKSQAGNTAQQIKSYIQNAYNSWELPPTFVTLVGDVDQIPNFIGSGSGTPPTDLNYALLEGSDYFPDVYVGRLSVANSSQLQDVLDKIVSYETTAWSQGYDWAQRAYFMASDDPGFHQVAEGTHLYCMNIVRNHGMIADSLFAFYNTGTPIPDALNSGRSLAVYSGHGSVDGWYGPNFHQGNINALTNLDKYPMVESFACETGDYTQPECFMETWLRAPHKGAVAALGSSVTSYWDEDDILQRRMFDAQFDSTLYWTMGFINMGKYLLYLHYGNTGTVRRYFEMYNLQGDPAMDVFTLSPETLYVSHPGAVPIGPTNVTVTVTDPNGVVSEALVTIRTADSIYATGWTDESGAVTLSITTTQVEPIYVTVTAHNHRPSTTSIQVVSDLPYVSLVYFELHDDNGDGYISPMENATLDIYAKNWGNQPAHGVTSVLRANTDDITITDSVQYFGDFEPGDSIFVSSAFSFTANSSVTNAQSLPFEILFISSDGDTWVSPFNLMGGTPVLAYNGVTVSDPSGNGVVDPGETADLSVSLLNEGLCPSDSSMAILRTNDSFIQILDSIAQFPQILPDSSATGTPFTIAADSSTPLHHSATFQIQVTSGQYSFTDTFELMIGVGGHFLVWDPDPNTSSGPVIANLLESLGLQGDYSTALSPYLDELPYYQSVFVCVGIYSDNYIIESSSPEAQALADYLTNHGGNMYLEGGDVWYYDPQYSNGYDFGPLFGINATDDGTGDLSTVVGEPGTFTENMSFPYTGENAWIDHLQPVGNGFTIFHNQSPYYICAVANIDSSNGIEHRTVGMSFELGGLQDGTWTKEDLVSAIVQFFGIMTGVKEETSTHRPLVLALNNPQPNPFSRQTAITFSIPKKQTVEVSVFDVTGRRVKTLLNSKLQPGIYTVKWNGTDSHGGKVSQGLYFVSLKTPTKSLTRKLALVR